MLGTLVLIAGMNGSVQAGMVSMGGESMHNNSPPGSGGGVYHSHIYLLPPKADSGFTGTEFHLGHQIQLFDVAGLNFDSVTTISGGPFTFSSQNVGPLPPSSSFTDDPTIPNLDLTYTGPTLTALTGGEPIFVGTFSFTTSGFAVASQYNFAAQTADLLPNGDLVEGISYGVATFTLVPEPATWFMVLTSLPAVLWLRRRRQNRAIRTRLELA
jgi:hypothetical protein